MDLIAAAHLVLVRQPMSWTWNVLRALSPSDCSPSVAFVSVQLHPWFRAACTPELDLDVFNSPTKGLQS